MSDDPVRILWNEFVQEIEPHRPSLFSYCLALTNDPFDAEDLVSEAMMKTFASRAFTSGNVEQPIAFLIRVASRLWIDEARRRNRLTESEAIPGEQTGVDETLEDVSLLYELEPVERAIVVLKEVFDLTHKEIAHALSISVAHSRVVLHRAKSDLAAVVALPRKPRATAELIQRFIEAFATHDVEQVKALMLDEIETAVHPAGREFRSKHDLEWLPSAMGLQVDRLELAEVLGERVILVFVGDEGSAQLREVWVLEESDGAIARVVDYGYSPHFVTWVQALLEKRSGGEV